MVNAKYEKYIIREPLFKRPMGPSLYVDATMLHEFPITLVIRPVTDPRLWETPKPHSHPYDEIFFFLGGNPLNYFDADFELEVSLGEDDKCEKIVIDTPSVLYVPKGLLHCPFVFKKVNKPLFYGHILLGPTYMRTGEEPSHARIEPYTPEEKAKLKAGIFALQK